MTGRGDNIISKEMKILNMGLVTKFPKKLRELISRSLKPGFVSGRTHVRLIKDNIELEGPSSTRK